MTKKQIDWEAIEREYRTGQLSIREIARQHDIGESSIRKKANQEDWERDLSGKIRQKIDTKLVRSEVRSEVRTQNEREIIEVAANQGVKIVQFHRKDAEKQRGILSKLSDSLDKKMKELKNNDNLPEFSDLKECSIVMRNFSQSLKTLVDIERQAFNLDEIMSGTSIVITAIKPARGVDEASL